MEILANFTGRNGPKMGTWRHDQKTPKLSSLRAWQNRRSLPRLFGGLAVEARECCERFTMKKNIGMNHVEKYEQFATYDETYGQIMKNQYVRAFTHVFVNREKKHTVRIQDSF